MAARFVPTKSVRGGARPLRAVALAAARNRMTKPIWADGVRDFQSKGCGSLQRRVRRRELDDAR
jgi:hypothetical protein